MPKVQEDNTQKLIKYLSEQPDDITASNLSDISYTLQTGREDFQWRRIGVGKNAAELINSLTQSSMGFSSKDVQQNVVFMFPGQGIQYHAMAKQLMQEIPYYSELVKEGIQLATSYLDCNLLDIIDDPSDERLKQTQYAQPALFIFEYALAQLLISYGVKPAALIGHSIGEYVAACLSGVISFKDGIALVCERGMLMATVEAGAMIAVECTEEEFSTYQKVADVELALHNSTNYCVAGGSFAAIVKLEQHLVKLKKAFHRLKVSHAFHSRCMEEIEQPFTELFSNITLSPPSIPMISNVTGDWLSTNDAMDVRAI